MKNEKDDAGLNYVESGTGNIVLIFLHYFGGSSKAWSKVIDELDESFRCIAVDMPGFGDSDVSIKEPSVGYYADSVLKLIRNLELKSYILIGHSMGGKIALSIASLKPLGLNSIVLLAPSPPTPEPMDDEARKQLLAAYRNPAALKILINKITACTLTDHELNLVIEDNVRSSLSSWKWWLERGSCEDISHQMSDIDVPVSVISGEKDSTIPVVFLKDEFVKYFPAAELVQIPEAGHLLPYETPLALARLIRDRALL